jgi:hypothetical protein
LGRWDAGTPVPSLPVIWLFAMKFGHSLARNQVPEWSSSYINYKGLKKLIKAAANAARNGEDPDLAGK